MQRCETGGRCVTTCKPDELAVSGTYSGDERPAIGEGNIYFFSVGTASAPIKASAIFAKKVTPTRPCALRPYENDRIQSNARLSLGQTGFAEPFNDTSVLDQEGGVIGTSDVRPFLNRKARH